MRYYALYSNAGWVVFDNCVDKGQGAVRIGMVQEQRHAQQICEAMNAADDTAKTAAAEDRSSKDYREDGRDGRDGTAVGIVARSGAYSLDVETHAKRYYVGPGGLCVYGSHEAIDAVRGKLNSRYLNLVQERDINKRLRANLADAQQAADKFKALANDAMDKREATQNKLEETQKELAGARDWWGSDYTQVSNAAISRTLGVTMVDHVARLEEKAKELERLRKRISEL